jgi:hypothetical protein
MLLLVVLNVDKHVTIKDFKVQLNFQSTESTSSNDVCGLIVI